MVHASEQDLQITPFFSLSLSLSFSRVNVRFVRLSTFHIQYTKSYQGNRINPTHGLAYFPLGTYKAVRAVEKPLTQTACYIPVKIMTQTWIILQLLHVTLDDRYQ